MDYGLRITRMLLQKRFLSDLIGVVLISVLLPLLVIGVGGWRNAPQRARGSALNQGEDGVSVFANWLQTQGFRVEMQQPDATIRSSNQDKVLFVIAPRGRFRYGELYNLDVWVRNGGTLIIAQENGQSRELLRYYDLGLGRLWWPVAQSSLALPVFNWPPVGQAAVNARRFIEADCGQVAVHMGDCARPYLVAMGRGQGQIIVLSAVTPFTNAGLRQPGDAQLVQNMVLATAVPGATILFDEAHRQSSPAWLFTTPAGWALWLTVLGIGLFIAWNSASSPVGRARTKSAPGEQEVDTAVAINQLAAAERQFHHHEVIMAHYWRRLQQSLAQRYGVDSALPDAQFVAALKPLLNETELGTVAYLAAYRERADALSENELRQWVSVAAELTDQQPLTREIYEYQKAI
ncbi:MAG: DUF4350 domain-containing protein [Chloroflexi bacterium]|nr:DUF4350 domain-containing protein [Chloroflexota bacterium]